MDEQTEPHALTEAQLAAWVQLIEYNAAPAYAANTSTREAAEIGLQLVIALDTAQRRARDLAIALDAVTAERDQLREAIFEAYIAWDEATTPAEYHAAVQPLWAIERAALAPPAAGA